MDDSWTQQLRKQYQAQMTDQPSSSCLDDEVMVDAIVAQQTLNDDAMDHMLSCLCCTKRMQFLMSLHRESTRPIRSPVRFLAMAASLLLAAWGAIYLIKQIPDVSQDAQQNQIMRETSLPYTVTPKRGSTIVAVTELIFNYPDIDAMTDKVFTATLYTPQFEELWVSNRQDQGHFEPPNNLPWTNGTYHWTVEVTTPSGTEKHGPFAFTLDLP